MSARVAPTTPRTRIRARDARARCSSNERAREFAPRARCPSCGRATVACACAACARALDVDGLGLIANACEIVIIQDRKEFRRALGSAAIAKRALAKCEVTWYEENEDGTMDAPIPRCGVERAGMLWPSDDAMDLKAYCAMDIDERPALEVLVVIDSTWSRAKAMYHAIPWLAKTRKYVVEPKRLSNYRIRAQPNARFLSTAECVSQALMELEPNSRAYLLERAFDYMIDDHLAAMNAAGRAPRRRSKGAD